MGGMRYPSTAAVAKMPVRWIRQTLYSVRGRHAISARIVSKTLANNSWEIEGKRSLYVVELIRKVGNAAWGNVGLYLS